MHFPLKISTPLCRTSIYLISTPFHFLFQGDCHDSLSFSASRSLSSLLVTMRRKMFWIFASVWNAAYENASYDFMRESSFTFESIKERNERLKNSGDFGQYILALTNAISEECTNSRDDALPFRDSSISKISWTSQDPSHSPDGTHSQALRDYRKRTLPRSTA